MEALFKTAKQNRIFQDVVHQVQEAIVSGRLKEGERLPSERELKEMLGTSRSTVREALRVLEHMGLIEIRLGMGGGAVVKSVSTDQISASLDLLIRTRKISLAHLAEFRECAEGEVMGLAARRITPREMRELTALLKKAEACVDRGTEAVEEFLNLDKELHLAFARMSDNPVFFYTLKTIHDNIKHYFDNFLTMERKEMEENYRDMHDIVEALKQRDGETAGRIVRAHVRRFNGYMQRKASGKSAHGAESGVKL